MKLRLFVPLLGVEIVLRLLGFTSPISVFSISILSSVVLLESQRDFESMAANYSGGKMKASAPALILGKSGVKHEFSFALLEDPGKPVVVVDTELSVKEVDEMKVLKFYVKVFDVSPSKAVLCVSPKLAERARSLAKEYGIVVLEDDLPRNLINKASDVVKTLVNKG